MKHFLIVLVGILVWTTVAMGETVEQGLPQSATEQVRTSAHRAINSGLDHDAVMEMTRSMLEHNFDPDHILQAHAILMESHQQGLPVEPIMNKAHEGMAKQIPGENVVRAMEQVQSRHQFAAEHAQTFTRNRGQMTRISELMADSLAAGIHRKDAARIMQTLQTRSQHMTQAQTIELATETLMTTRALARQGQASAMAADTVCKGLQQGWGPQEMHAMRNKAMTNFMRNSSHGSNQGQGQHGGYGDHSGGSGSGMGGPGGHSDGSGSGMGGPGDHSGDSGAGTGGSGGGMGGGGHM